jgi:hypothetical protein
MLDRTATQWLDCNAAICPYYHPRLESPAYAQWQAKPAPEQRQQRRQAGQRLNREAPPPSAFALAAAAFQDHTPGVAQVGQELLAGMLAREPLPVLLERFRGGTVRVVGNTEMSTVRELPLEAFYARIALLKNAMQGLERSIRDSALDQEGKDKASKDLAGIGGSMTTFNLLFQLKQETFKGTGER